MMTEQEILATLHSWGIRVTEAPLPGTLRGHYCHTTRTITLRKGLTTPQRRATLAHEYIHALKAHDGPQDQLTEAWVDEQAALLIINPAELALAEALYGPNPCALARELDATPGLVCAYMRAMERHPTRTK
ncbi:ImmA/IrrE family metallo-endopeptidase [Actinotignum schaalii]|uniref:ImmA/IrrE family metallo-endopeptidase n=1 Tax=Actinotignum TaxID=1653174 RepID=UPI00237DFB98|nr:ImmA/IrrE family metallo-endopeptidase [Actinotignum sanguinis]MDE1552256.1 ImmA/IrrE family metallo-endopeptidase [Actinotignum sanguinis]